MTIMATLDFQPMLITELFNLHNGLGAPKKSAGPVPYVAASFHNNGIVGYVEEEMYPGGWLSFVKDGDGGAGTCFFQPRPFWPSNHVFALEPKTDRATESSLLALASIITHQCFPKYNRGFAANAKRLSRQHIMVPVLTGQNGAHTVDWDGLTELGNQLTQTVQARTATVRRVDPAPIDEPELEFHPTNVLEVPGRQEGIFRAHKGKRLTKANRNPGNVPFVAGSRVNNSIVDYADAPALFPGGWITLIYNGDGGTGHAKFQPVPFNAADDVIALEPISPDATEDALMLLVTLLTQQCVPKFGFGYKLTLHRLGRQRILVPMTEGPDGSMIVDWEGMDAYGRFLRQQAESRMIEAVGEPR